MKKTIYKEPAFLKDIHQNQISNYKKTRILTISERISQFIKQAQRGMDKMGLRSIEFTRS